MGHFGINKIRELVARNYFWAILCWNVKAYVRGCNICLASKEVYHKSYRNFQFLPISTHCWKDFSIYFVIGFSLLVDWKSNSYNKILVIVNYLTKIVYYIIVMITIDVSGLMEVIINIVMRYYRLLKSIISNYSSLLNLSFWSLL